MGELLQSRFQRGVILVEGKNQLLRILNAHGNACELGVLAAITVNDRQNLYEQSPMVTLGSELKKILAPLLIQGVFTRRR